MSRKCLGLTWPRPNGTADFRAVRQSFWILCEGLTFTVLTSCKSAIYYKEFRRTKPSNFGWRYNLTGKGYLDCNDTSPLLKRGHVRALQKPGSRVSPQNGTGCSPHRKLQIVLLLNFISRKLATDNQSEGQMIPMQFVTPAMSKENSPKCGIYLRRKLQFDYDFQA
jgi:hypothetical protein